MKQKIITIINHPLISGSAVIVFGSLFANFFNFLFNLFMVRNLSVSDYGTLASLVSLITLATLPAGAAMPSIVKFAGTYFAKGDLDKAKGLFLKILKINFGSGLIIFLGIMFFSARLGNFFLIKDQFLLLVSGLSIIVGFSGAVNTGFLQAKLQFKYQSIINTVGSVSKLLLGVVFVYLGFAIRGAISVYFLSFFLTYLLSFMPLRYILNKKNKTPLIDNKELFSYGFPSALALFSLTSFITVDILIVKHFFDPRIAGIYAGVSLISKIIFYLSAPIGSVMFPLVVQKHAKGEKYQDILKLSILLTVLPSIVLTFFYFLFSKFTIQFFSNSRYLEGSYLLGIFAVFITIYSFLSILTNFYLSINKTFVYIPLLIGAISQVLLIMLFHKTLSEVIYISIGITGLLLTGFLLYYFKFYDAEQKK